jgi:hypothetical protein
MAATSVWPPIDADLGHYGAESDGHDAAGEFSAEVGGVGREHGSDDSRAARRFLERLAALPEDFRHPALPPLLEVDPYLSAWTNVEAALGNAPAPERRLAVAAELDRELRSIDLTPEMKEAARRAVRAPARAAVATHPRELQVRLRAVRDADSGRLTVARVRRAHGLVADPRSVSLGAGRNFPALAPLHTKGHP